jgi:iron complex outermembrane receptor protein
MNKPRGRPSRALGIAVGLSLAVGSPSASAGSDDPFFDLDLKEVLNLEITSVSRKPQTVSQAAAAVFVITADDIRRSGATTIPDVLRMAPGIQVGQISSDVWAVSARGMDGRFTNKLLVLMDGRSVYTPTFSGVYWDVQDTILADIERIEVIRGPGASLWGANAVNGVINIITRAAAATQGWMATAGAGDEERGFASLRYGGRLGDIGNWRAYAKGFARDGSTIAASGAPGDDDWRQYRAGFRSDFSLGGRDAFTVQGDYYEGDSGESSLVNALQPPYNRLVGTTQKLSGWNLLARWQREVSASDSFTLQAYVDRTRRDWPARLNDERYTYDLDFQFRTRRFAGHDLVMGAGYRLSRDDLSPSFSGVPADTLPFALFSPASASRELISAFLQDDITVAPDKLVLTLGAKFEHNDDTGLEVQPNARVLWRPIDTATVWGSVARAVRTPSRADSGGVINLTVVPPFSPRNASPLPTLVQAAAGVDSEELIAYEAGWKQQLTPSFSFDLALFHNEYDRLRTGRFGTPVCLPSGLPASLGCFFLPQQTHLLQPSPFGNEATGRSKGAELSADWRPRPELRLQLALTRLWMSIDAQEGAFSTDTEESFADLLGSLRLAWNPRPDVDADLWLRYSDGLPEVTAGIGAPAIPRYTELDLRLAWRPSLGVELSLVGRNLLQNRHEEFPSELLDVPLMQIERSVFAQINWKF